MVLEQLDVRVQKNKNKNSRHRPYTLHKDQLKWVIELHAKNELTSQEINKYVGNHCDYLNGSTRRNLKSLEVQ